MNYSQVPSPVLRERDSRLADEQAAALALGVSPHTLVSIRNDRHRIRNELERRGPELVRDGTTAAVDAIANS